MYLICVRTGAGCEHCRHSQLSRDLCCHLDGRRRFVPPWDSFDLSLHQHQPLMIPDLSFKQHQTSTNLDLLFLRTNHNLHVFGQRSTNHSHLQRRRLTSFLFFGNCFRSVDSLGRQRSKRRRSLRRSRSSAADGSNSPDRRHHKRRRRRQHRTSRTTGDRKRRPRRGSDDDEDKEMDALEKLLGWRGAAARAPRSPSVESTYSSSSGGGGGGGGRRRRGGGRRRRRSRSLDSRSSSGSSTEGSVSSSEEVRLWCGLMGRHRGFLLREAPSFVS